MVVQVESRDTATGISYLIMIATIPGADDKPPFLSKGPIYFREFKDHFVREHGVWMFQKHLGSIQMKFAVATPA